LNQDDFTAAFPTPDSFGTVRQQRQPGMQTVDLELTSGRLPLRELHFAVPADWADVTIRAERREVSSGTGAGGTAIATQLARRSPGFVAIRFTDPVELTGRSWKQGSHDVGTTWLRVTLVQKS
jgi:hypothetical protein